MMSRLRFEDFSAPPAEQAAPGASGGAAVQAAASAAAEMPDVQEVRLNAYEDGYKAGWDDATAAEAQAQERVSADFAKTLQDLSFSYHEARSHVVGALGPLLTAMVERLMPQIAAAGFARTVVETALQMAEKEADHPISVRVSPENRVALEHLAQGQSSLPLKVVEDDTLGPGQAMLSSVICEREVDIDAMLSAIRTALDEFLTAEKEARKYG